MVHDLNFVEESVQTKKTALSEQEKGTLFIKEIERGTLDNSGKSCSFFSLTCSITLYCMDNFCRF